MYPGDFVRLVIIGKQWDDDFNTTLSFVPTSGGSLGVQPITDAFIASVASVIGTWWNAAPSSTGPGFLYQALLTSIKLNVIDSAGHYRDPDAKEYTYATPVRGATTSSDVRPPQLTIVHTLEGAAPRALAGRGRMYLPPQVYSPLAVDGRLSTGNAAATAGALKTLINSLNSLFAADATGDEVDLSAGIASNTRSGAFQVAEGVSVGRVVDTMRSRRNKFQEDRETVAIP